MFEPFGITKNRHKKAVPVNECKDFIFAIEVFDWVNVKTGEGLTGYVPTAQLEWLLAENIDTDLQ